MISMTRSSFIIDKYDKQRIPYEDRGKEYDSSRKREERQKELMEICNDLFYECERYKHLKLDIYQRQRVEFLVNKFGDKFKLLHGTAKKETIILAFIFFIKKKDNPHIRIDEYKITSEYKLTNNIFEIIICRLLEYHMINTPVPPYGSTNYNHEILSKHGGIL